VNGIRACVDEKEQFANLLQYLGSSTDRFCGQTKYSLILYNSECVTLVTKVIRLTMHMTCNVAAVQR